MRAHFMIPGDFVAFRPGIEIKFACEEAQRLGCKTYFMGAELDQNTWGRLLHETRASIIEYFYRKICYIGHIHWTREREDIISRL